MDRIRIGCTSECSINEFYADAFPVTNPFRVLLTPALRALNYSASVPEVEPITSFTNLSDPFSLPSRLNAGAYEMYEGMLALNAKRFPLMKFSYPFLYTSLVFAMKKPSPSYSSPGISFLTSPFGVDVWLVVVALLVALVLLTFAGKEVERRIGLSLGPFVALVGFLNEFALSGVVCVLYLAALKSTATTAGFNLAETPTIEHLTEHVASNEYALVVSTLIDFRFEFINTSENDDIRKFKAALEVNPPIVLKSLEYVCAYLVDSDVSKNDSRLFFTIDVPGNLLESCGDYNTKLINVEIPGQVGLMFGFVFSSNVDTVRRKIDKLVLAGFYVAEDERMKRAYAEVTRAKLVGDDDAASDDTISSADVIESFWLFLAGTLLSGLALAAELCFARRGRWGHST